MSTWAGPGFGATAGPGAMGETDGAGMVGVIAGDGVTVVRVVLGVKVDGAKLRAPYP